MATARQELGTFGEKHVAQQCACPKCKRSKTLVLLPPNFKCADLICDFCGYLIKQTAQHFRLSEATVKRYCAAAAGAADPLAEMSTPLTAAPTPEPTGLPELSGPVAEGIARLRAARGQAVPPTDPDHDPLLD